MKPLHIVMETLQAIASAIYDSLLRPIGRIALVVLQKLILDRLHRIAARMHHA